jgi:hypothetical protein
MSIIILLIETKNMSKKIWKCSKSKYKVKQIYFNFLLGLLTQPKIFSASFKKVKEKTPY